MMQLAERRFLFAAVCALTTACTLGPDFKGPAAPATAYSKSLPQSDATARVNYGNDVAADWYGVFHSDALNGLVHQALANIDVTGQVGRNR